MDHGLRLNLPRDDACRHPHVAEPCERLPCRDPEDVRPHSEELNDETGGCARRARTVEAEVIGRDGSDDGQSDLAGRDSAGGRIARHCERAGRAKGPPGANRALSVLQPHRGHSRRAMPALQATADHSGEPLRQLPRGRISRHEASALRLAPPASPFQNPARPSSSYPDRGRLLRSSRRAGRSPRPNRHRPP